MKIHRTWEDSKESDRAKGLRLREHNVVNVAIEIICSVMCVAWETF